MWMRVGGVGGGHAAAGPDGHPEFLPPAWLDPDRHPRRNHDHRRT